MNVHGAFISDRGSIHARSPTTEDESSTNGTERTAMHFETYLQLKLLVENRSVHSAISKTTSKVGHKSIVPRSWLLHASSPLQLRAHQFYFGWNSSYISFRGVFSKGLQPKVSLPRDTSRSRLRHPMLLTCCSVCSYSTNFGVHQCMACWRAGSQNGVRRSIWMDSGQNPKCGASQCIRIRGRSSVGARGYVS